MMIILHGPEAIKPSMIIREPLATPGSWFVYQSPSGKYAVIDSGNRISQIEIKANNYKSRFTVQKANIPFKYNNEYTSKNPGRSFHVSIHAKVVAEDPVLIIQNEVSDAEDVFKRDTDYWLSQLCGQYTISELQELKLATRNFETNTELKSDTKSKGFSISNFEIGISLSNEDMEFYKVQEQIKQNEEIERLRLIEMKRTRELRIQEEDEELERQRQRSKLEQQDRLLAEQEEEKRRKRLKEERRADNERLEQLRKKEGLESVIFERDEENAENVDLLLSDAKKEKEHQRQIEVARNNAELEENKRKQEHNRLMEEKQRDFLLKAMENQMKSGNVDDTMLRTIYNVFGNSTNDSTFLDEKKSDVQQISFKVGDSDSSEDQDEKNAASDEKVWNANGN